MSSGSLWKPEAEKWPLEGMQPGESLTLEILISSPVENKFVLCESLNL